LKIFTLGIIKLKISLFFRKSLFHYKLILIIIFGFLLRLLSLNKPFLGSFDEALSLYIAQQPPAKIWFLHLKGIDFTFPFFNYLLSLWIKISTSIIWARIFSLIFGIITIYLTYKIGSFLFNKEIGFLGAFFVSCSENFIWYSVESRVYSLFTVFVLLALFYFLKFIYNPSFKERLFFILFTALSIYAHFFGFFLLLIQFFILILNRKKIKTTFKELIIYFVSIIILISPLIFYYTNQYYNFYKMGNYWRKCLSCFCYLKDTFEIYSDHRYILWLYIILFWLFIFKKLKDLKLLEKDKKLFFNTSLNPALQFPLVFLFLPLLSTCILSIGRLKIFKPNYVMPFFIFFYLLLSKMILGYKNKAKKFILLLIVPILFSNGLRFSLSTGILGAKEELYRIHRLLKDNAVKNDLIVSDYIPNSISIFASLNVPIKIITNKKILNKAKLFQADFFNE